MCDYLKDFTKKELIDLVHGLSDVIAGRTYTSKQIARRLKFGK